MTIDKPYPDEVCSNTDKLDSLKKEFPNINVLKFDVSEHSKIEEFRR